jgi:hypothetical protein
MKRPKCLSRRFDLEHGDKARQPLRQQIDPASTRSHLRSASCIIMLPSSGHDASCNRSKIVVAASQLSLREPNTLAMTLGETL